MTKHPLKRFGLFTALAALGLLFNGDLNALFMRGPFVSEARAKVGRPLTPGSVAGVTRRVVRRSHIYVSVLPAHCVKVVINGAHYWHCGGHYYQHYSGRYVIVYVH